MVIAFGKARLLVHVHDEPRFVRVYSPIVRKVELQRALLERLNGLNEHARFVRFLFANGAVWASLDVLAHPLVPAHVVHACEVVGEVVNDLRDGLEAELGRALSPAPSAPRLLN
jgi:hypothetical protein